jgi:MoaA/NifB/PqqE/SkfB family radical SAM enzyme
MKKRQSKAKLNLIRKVPIKQKARILWYNLRHNERFSPFPLEAKIEICGHCNLDCVMCVRKSLHHRNRFMSVEEFKTILDHLPHTVVWSPHGYNEPLLHPDFFTFCHLAHQRNILLSLVTNATCLGPQTTDRLLLLNPLQIRVSLEGVGKAYERIRRGARWRSVYQNLQYLANATKAQQIPFSLYVTVWRENIRNIPSLIALAEELDAPIKFTDITYQNEYGESTFENSLRENLSAKELQQIISSYSKENVRFGIMKNQKRACTLPWSSLYIDVTGQCYPCTDNLDWPMGNICHQPIRQIYNTNKYRSFRQQSLSGENLACKKCVSWGPQV